VEYSGATITVNDGVVGGAGGAGAGAGSNYEVARTEVHPVDPSHQRNLTDIAFMNNMHEGKKRALFRFGLRGGSPVKAPPPPPAPSFPVTSVDRNAGPHRRTSLWFKGGPRGAS
jgi:hypothetical protein